MLLSRQASALPNARRAAVAVPLTAALVLLSAPSALLLLAAPAARAKPAVAAAGKARDGDVLKIFDGARVFVVTNDAPEVADRLLQGCDVKEKRLLTPEQWRQMPQKDVREFVTVVHLINRQRLPLGAREPEKCVAGGDQLWTEVTRWGRRWGAVHDVTLSAPDGAWLRRGVEEFRRLKQAPRGAQKRPVASLAVVPIGAGAAQAADALLLKPKRLPTGVECVPHRLTVEEADRVAERLAGMDEVYLVDRSAPVGELPEEVAAVFAGRMVGPNDTVAWRERKPNGYQRAVVTAPTAHALEEALERYGSDPLAVPEAQTVVASARDLRQVRRVAVAAVKAGPGGPLARRLATQAASAVRALDSFEVLERAGLTEVLGEIALGQAGITQASDRARVRQLAAADALLIVEVTDVHGQTEYRAQHDRLTPALGKPPRRPVEPSRLRYGVSLPGKEDDPIARALTDALLRKVVGTKSSRDYRDSMRAYNDETIPAYERQLESYYEQRRARPVKWRQTLVAHRGVTVSGSLRLVDLADGMVLWEAPFSASEREEVPAEQRTVTTYGEESNPGAAECPATVKAVPEDLAAKAADAALGQAVDALKTTALLPPPAAAPVVVASAGTGEEAPSPTLPANPVGRVIDIDGPTVLVGLGATDGVLLGDLLAVSLPDGKTARLKVTRVRPRTCDAVFDVATPAAMRPLVTVGREVRK